MQMRALLRSGRNSLSSRTSVRRSAEIGTTNWVHSACVLTASLKYVRDSEVSGPDRTPEIFVKGQRFDALRQIGRTIERANRDLLLVDGYISSAVLDLFTEKRPNVSVRILTKQVRPAVLKAAAAFAQDYGHIGIRLNDTIHDRFLVVDDSLFFHLGASVKDVGEKTFRISQIESAQEIEKLRIALAKAWSESEILFEP
jgi:hypothetical protein